MKRSWINSGTILIRVGPHHFAFLRGYLEGLDLASLSRRYLETAVKPDPELRVAKLTLKWIREQLMTAARRRGHFPDARLILIDPEKLRQAGKKSVPSLEEFREMRDPHELYPESELIELFHEEYGSLRSGDRRTERNERLRRRQLAALVAFEKLLGMPPSLLDDVGGWLDPGLAKRLKASGLHTLGALVNAINGRGYRWWIHVPRFGEKAAAQVVAWLRTESVEKALGVALGVQARVKASKLSPASLEANRPKQTGIVPIECLSLPAELNGANGCNRGVHCTIGATNDLEAVHQWLALKPAGGSTWRSYRKEAERFLLWAILERKTALSSLSAADCLLYREFMQQLDESQSGAWPFGLPRSSWFAPRGTKRWSALWRPFEGPLSPQSQELAVTILTLLGKWLMDTGYWANNPWREAQSARPTRAAPKSGRLFADEHWRLLWNHLETTPRDGKYERLRFVLSLAQATRMRLSELINAQIGHLSGSEGNDWLIEAAHGTRYARKIPLPMQLIDDLDRYLMHRGLGMRAQCSASTYLIARLPSSAARMWTRNPEKPEVSANALYISLKNFFADAATSIEQGASLQGQILAGQVRQASTGWLRGTGHSAQALGLDPARDR